MKYEGALDSPNVEHADETEETKTGDMNDLCESGPDNISELFQLMMAMREDLANPENTMETVALSSAPTT